MAIKRVYIANFSATRLVAEFESDDAPVLDRKVESVRKLIADRNARQKQQQLTQRRRNTT
jgi:hypothetical protein